MIYRRPASSADRAMSGHEKGALLVTRLFRFENGNDDQLLCAMGMGAAVFTTGAVSASVTT